MGKLVGDGNDKWVRYILLRIKFPRLFDLAVEKDCTVELMGRRGWVVDGGAWRRQLFAWEE